jgi:hypothetical protein
MRHKHADLIKAWADGAEIEYFNGINHEWRTFVKDHNVWYESWEYRIKPEPKPDYVRYLEMPMFWGYSEKRPESNMKVVFDGETGDLKSAEVLK